MHVKDKIYQAMVSNNKKVDAHNKKVDAHNKKIVQDTPNLRVNVLKQDNIRMYEFTQSTELLMIFTNDDTSTNQTPSHNAPFIPVDSKCKAEIKIYYHDRIYLIYTKQKKDLQLNIDALFYLKSPPKLYISFSVMILHHTGIIDLFNKCTDFKKFLTFASIGARNETTNDNFEIQGYEKEVLEFALKHRIGDQGLFCIDNMEGVDKNFSKSFAIFIQKLNILSMLGLYNIHQQSEDVKQYQKAFKDIDKYCNEYKKNYQATQELSSFLVTLVQAIDNVNQCIEQAVINTHTTQSQHYCICEKKENDISALSMSAYVADI